MIRLPVAIPGMVVEPDFQSDAWHISYKENHSRLREWSWRERRRLVTAGTASGSLDADAFINGVFSLLLDPVPPDESTECWAYAVMQLLRVPENSEVASIAEGEYTLAREFGWRPDEIDRSGAGSIDKMLEQIMMHRTDGVSGMQRTYTNDGWTRLIIADEPQAIAGEAHESIIDSQSPIDRQIQLRLSRMFAAISAWAGIDNRNDTRFSHSHNPLKAEAESEIVEQPAKGTFNRQKAGKVDSSGMHSPFPAAQVHLSQSEHSNSFPESEVVEAVGTKDFRSKETAQVNKVDEAPRIKAVLSRIREKENSRHLPLENLNMGMQSERGLELPSGLYPQTNGETPQNKGRNHPGSDEINVDREPRDTLPLNGSETPKPIHKVAAKRFIERYTGGLSQSSSNNTTISNSARIEESLPNTADTFKKPLSDVTGSRESRLPIEPPPPGASKREKKRNGVQAPNSTGEGIPSVQVEVDWPRFSPSKNSGNRGLNDIETKSTPQNTFKLLDARTDSSEQGNLFESSELEEKIADILERAIRESGIDLS